MQTPSKNSDEKFVLWPNGMVCKSFIFPILIIAAALCLQVYLGLFPLSFLLPFVVFLGGPIVLFLAAHKIVVTKTHVQGPMMGSVWSKTKIMRPDAVFVLDQKIMGIPAFIIKDRKTDAEINVLRFYFSKRSLNRLKELVVSK